MGSGLAYDEIFCQTAPFILGLLIKVRGELHHHTARRRRIGHSGEQAVYRADAMFLGRTAHRICLDLLEEALGIV